MLSRKLFVIFYFFVITQAINIKGNGDKIKTYRATTRYKRVIFGNLNSTNDDTNFKIQSTKPIEIDLFFNDKEEMIIDCDQNLQKYFLLESNGDYLNIKLDYFEDVNQKTIYYSDKDQIKLDKNEINYIEPVEPIKIIISSKNSELKINKHNFGKLNFNMERKSYLVEPIDVNSTVAFDCDGKLFYNGINNGESSSVRTFSLETNYKTKSINVSMCDETYSLYFHNDLNIMSFFAKK